MTNDRNQLMLAAEVFTDAAMLLCSLALPSQEGGSEVGDTFADNELRELRGVLEATVLPLQETLAAVVPKARRMLGLPPESRN